MVGVRRAGGGRAGGQRRTLWFALIPATRGLKGPLSSSLEHRRGSLLAIGLLLVLAIAGLFGVAMGAGEVAIPAFAIEQGTDRPADCWSRRSLRAGSPEGSWWEP